MASNSANEQELGALHAKTAKVLSQALEILDVAQLAYIETGGLQTPKNEELGLPALYANPPMLSPALMSAITKFLKDNSITAQPEDSVTMSDLEAALAEKRKRREIRRVDNVLHFDPLDEAQSA
jgi:hypothetical protein